MKFVDEFRDPAAARALVKSITDLAGDDEYKFMEVCGGHTHTIYRHGIEHLLPPNVELVHGPGCPVCVIPMGRVDDAMWLAEQPGCHLHDVRRHDARAGQPGQPARGEGARRRRPLRLLAAGRAADRDRAIPSSEVVVLRGRASRPRPRRRR